MHQGFDATVMTIQRILCQLVFFNNDSAWGLSYETFYSGKSYYEPPNGTPLRAAGANFGEGRVA